MGGDRQKDTATGRARGGVNLSKDFGKAVQWNHAIIPRSFWGRGLKNPHREASGERRKAIMQKIAKIKAFLKYF